MVLMENLWISNSIQGQSIAEKKLELHYLARVVRSVSNDGNKYYPQFFLNAYLYILVG